MTTNINTARREANSYSKAIEIIKEGYTFTKDAETEVIAVCKPGRMAASYWINVLEPGCDCPDYMKRGTFCKHTIAWSILEEERERGDFSYLGKMGSSHLLVKASI